MPIIINTRSFDSPPFRERKYPVLLQLCYCYAFEPNGAYLCKGWRSYSLWISRALVQIWLLWSVGHTHTGQAQWLNGDPAEWLSLCLMCLNHLADTILLFLHKPKFVPFGKQIVDLYQHRKPSNHAYWQLNKSHTRVWINLAYEISVRITECLSYLLKNMF